MPIPSKVAETCKYRKDVPDDSQKTSQYLQVNYVGNRPLSGDEVLHQVNCRKTLQNIYDYYRDARFEPQNPNGIGSAGIAGTFSSYVDVIKCFSHPNSRWNGAQQIGQDESGRYEQNFHTQM